MPCDQDLVDEILEEYGLVTWEIPPPKKPSHKRYLYTTIALYSSVVLTNGGQFIWFFTLTQPFFSWYKWVDLGFVLWAMWGIAICIRHLCTS
jgi:hypothetical protein